MNQKTQEKIDKLEDIHRELFEIANSFAGEETKSIAAQLHAAKNKVFVVKSLLRQRRTTMIVIQDSAGVIVKQNMPDKNFVRLDDHETAAWVNGNRHVLTSRSNTHPVVEHSINDFNDLLDAMKQIENSEVLEDVLSPAIG